MVKTMSLFKRRFREELPPLVTWGIILFLTGLALMLAGLFIDKMQIADSLNDDHPKDAAAVRNMFGGTMTTHVFLPLSPGDGL